MSLPSVILGDYRLHRFFKRMGRDLRILIPLIILISSCLIPSVGRVNAIVSNGTKIIDPHLQIESLFKGISNPTSMAFLGNDDILVLEKNEGTVKRIVNGTYDCRALA